MDPLVKGFSTNGAFCYLMSTIKTNTKMITWFQKKISFIFTAHDTLNTCARSCGFHLFLFSKARSWGIIIVKSVVYRLSMDLQIMQTVDTTEYIRGHVKIVPKMVQLLLIVIIRGNIIYLNDVHNKTICIFRSCLVLGVGCILHKIIRCQI